MGLNTQCGKQQDRDVARFDNPPIKKKTFKVKHAEPGDFCMDYILLPIGYSYNSEWVSAKKGDRIRLHDGGIYTIYCVRMVKVKGGLADMLSRLRYGITIAGCIQRWKMNAKLEGHTSDAVSSEECLWVMYEKSATGEEGHDRRKIQD